MRGYLYLCADSRPAPRLEGEGSVVVCDRDVDNNKSRLRNVLVPDRHALVGRCHVD
ncbi:hypothetical protein OIE87_00800 [Streptomyces mirabilis]|nr:hypothetical protein [Streptomyces mirabilis]